MPRSTDQGFVAKIDQVHKANRNFKTAQMTRKGPKSFTIIHYAGEVVYSSHGFLEKNKDLLYQDMYEAMTASTQPLTADMFPAMSKEQACSSHSAFLSMTSAHVCARVFSNRNPRSPTCDTTVWLVWWWVTRSTRSG